VAENESEITNLIQRIADGDPDAENIFFNQFDEKIELIVRLRLINKIPPEDIKDISADVKTAIIKALREGKYDPERGKISTYIAAISQNYIALYFRKLKSNRETLQGDFDENIRDDSQTWLDENMTTEMQKKLQNKLSHLRSNYKKVLFMTFYEGKSTSEIANHLGFTNKKVIDLKYNALKKLFEQCQNDDFFSIISILLQIL
jgi:RNA polymerase sigma-70 factor (ECF subfamily)